MVFARKEFAGRVLKSFPATDLVGSAEKLDLRRLDRRAESKNLLTGRLGLDVKAVNILMNSSAHTEAEPAATTTKAELGFRIYVSFATHPFTQDELVELLQVSRKNNTAVGLTGILLYKEGKLMQLLEGARRRSTGPLPGCSTILGTAMSSLFSRANRRSVRLPISRWGSRIWTTRRCNLSRVTPPTSTRR
ncbi:MAG: BLUF domain-containing protein [Chthoniobacterales bacterium]|nr:BLUF domain-containing protein [Chthoniobacterales bacterium]